MKLLICGFMGAGKTTLLNRLKKRNLEYKFYELDDEVERRQESSIAQIFRDHGEEHFRKLEASALFELLARDEESIIALGGGTLETVCNEIGNLDDVMTIWLNVPFDECWERISSCANRPLVKSGKEAALKLYKQRKVRYSQCHIKVIGSDYSIDGLVEEIKKVQKLD